MNSKILLSLIFLILSTEASASMELAKAKNCMACHAMDKKLVGPAFVDVGNKYRNDADSAVMLADKIRKGGSGNWGAIPMPSNPQVSEKEAVVLAKWILAK